MISQFRVQHYKALRDVTLELTPMHVLIGPNDSGKTSLLEALQILSRTLDHDLQEAIPKRPPEQFFTFGDMSSPMELAVRINGNAEMGVEYRVQLNRSGEHWTVADSIAVDPSQEVDLSSSRDPSGHSGAFGWLRNEEQRAMQAGGPPSEEMDKALRKLDRSLRGAQFYRWIPRFLASPATLNESRRFRMEESGFGLPTMLDDILGYDVALFGKIQARFAEIFPEVERIILRTEQGYSEQPASSEKTPNTSGKGLAIKFKHMNEPLSVASVSDGYLLILAYLALMHSPKPPPVLLIEEPENGIHPRRLGEVMDMLRALNAEDDGPQIIMTTHSPDLVDLFAPEEVTLCLKEDDGSISTHRLSESEVVQQQKGVFTLGEIWGGEMDTVLAHGRSNPSETRKGSGS